MPKIVVVHDVVDVDKWLEYKAERADAIGVLGGSNVVDHVAQDGSNTVAVGADVDDLEGMMATLASPSPELGSLMASHGVVPPLAVYVER